MPSRQRQKSKCGYQGRKQSLQQNACPWLIAYPELATCPPAVADRVPPISQRQGRDGSSFLRFRYIPPLSFPSFNRHRMITLSPSSACIHSTTKSTASAAVMSPDSTACIPSNQVLLYTPQLGLLGMKVVNSSI